MIISIKINNYMLYDTCNYHILHYSKLIIVSPITTVLIVNLTPKKIPMDYSEKNSTHITNVP